ncbi:MAG: hypothetical protein IT379_16545 [Deltaproteobacteria bacterium]|nr:hypothetical protein [Deltaproteobacteria bacterium]
MGGSRLLRLVTEELEAALAPDAVRTLLERAMDPTKVDASDAESLLACVHGPLREALGDMVRPDEAEALANRIADMLTPHVRSGIRKKREPTTPVVVQTQQRVSVGVVHGSDRALRDTLVAALGAVGIASVSLGSARGLSATPAASWVDAFLVTSDLSAHDARELAWFVANRAHPSIVVVWPVGDQVAPWAAAIEGAVLLGHPDVELLAATLVDMVGDLRDRGGD